MATREITELTDNTFDAEVLGAEEPVLVDFWAPWCAPCRVVAPTVESLASDLRGRVKVGKLNIDDNPEVTKQYGILSIPTLLVFKGGKVVDNLLGAVPKATIRSVLDRHLDGPAAGTRTK